MLAESFAINLTTQHLVIAGSCVGAILLLGITACIFRYKVVRRRIASAEQVRREERDWAAKRHREQVTKDEMELELGEWLPFYQQLQYVEGVSLRLAFLKKVMGNPSCHTRRGIQHLDPATAEELPKLTMAGMGHLLKLFHHGWSDSGRQQAQRDAEELLTLYVDFDFPKFEGSSR
jgi:hypothetical protein